MKHYGKYNFIIKVKYLFHIQDGNLHLLKNLDMDEKQMGHFQEQNKKCERIKEMIFKDVKQYYICGKILYYYPNQSKSHELI